MSEPHSLAACPTHRAASVVGSQRGIGKSTVDSQSTVGVCWLPKLAAKEKGTGPGGRSLLVDITGIGRRGERYPFERPM